MRRRLERCRRDPKYFIRKYVRVEDPKTGRPRRVRFGLNAAAFGDAAGMADPNLRMEELHKRRLRDYITRRISEMLSDSLYQK